MARAARVDAHRAHALPRPVARSTFAAGDATLAFECADAGAREWMDEFLRPWLPPGSPARERHVVQLVFDAARYEALAASRDAAKPAPVPCFRLDGGTLERTAWRTPAGPVVEDPDMGCLFQLEGARVTVCARPGDRRARVGAARILRELASLHLARSHWALHAAALVRDRRVVLIAGRRGAGKTTLLAHLLRSSDSDLVANDWTWLAPRPEGGFEATGMPTIVRVRPGTIGHLPWLLAGRPADGSFLPWARREIESGLADGMSSPAAAGLHLSLRQLAGRTGSGVQRGGRVAAILLPETDPRASGTTLERLEPGDALARLRDCQHGSQQRSGPGTIFGDRAPASPDWAAVVSRTPVFRCRLGPDAYAGGGSRLLDEVLA